jgi:hypothetical protein
MKPSRATLLEAVDHALAGDWQRAHEIVQDYEDDPTAGWIHGVVHWMEGDLGNARYWYGHCGRDMAKDGSPQQALREIRGALEGG